MNPTIQEQFSQLEGVKAVCMGMLLAMKDEQRAFKPSPEAWSILQVVEHLVLAEEVFLQMLRKDDSASLKKSVRDRLMARGVSLFFRLGLRAKIPVKAVDPKGEASLDELEKRWAKARGGIKETIDALPAERAERPVVRHPLAGPMTPLELYVFLEKHIQHHMKQIERIGQAEGFPGEI